MHPIKSLNVAIDAERTFRYEQPKVQKVTPVFLLDQQVAPSKIFRFSKNFKYSASLTGYWKEFQMSGSTLL